jgi:hypothetical protein
LLPELGLIGSIDPIRRPLEQLTDSGGGRLEKGRTHQPF